MNKTMDALNEIKLANEKLQQISHDKIQEDLKEFVQTFITDELWAEVDRVVEDEGGGDSDRITLLGLEPVVPAFNDGDACVPHYETYYLEEYYPRSGQMLKVAYAWQETVPVNLEYGFKLDPETRTVSVTWGTIVTY